jgi:hypothetical protein
VAGLKAKLSVHARVHLAVVGGGEGENGWTEGCVYFLFCGVQRASSGPRHPMTPSSGKDLNLYKKNKTT